MRAENSLFTRQWTTDSDEIITVDSCNPTEFESWLSPLRPRDPRTVDVPGYAHSISSSRQEATCRPARAVARGLRRPGRGGLWPRPVRPARLCRHRGPGPVGRSGPDTGHGSGGPGVARAASVSLEPDRNPTARRAAHAPGAAGGDRGRSRARGGVPAGRVLAARGGRPGAARGRAVEPGARRLVRGRARVRPGVLCPAAVLADQPRLVRVGCPGGRGSRDLRAAGDRPAADAAAAGLAGGGRGLVGRGRGGPRPVAVRVPVGPAGHEPGPGAHGPVGDGGRPAAADVPDRADRGHAGLAAAGPAAGAAPPPRGPGAGARRGRGATLAGWLLPVSGRGRADRGRGGHPGQRPARRDAVRPAPGHDRDPESRGHHGSAGPAGAGGHAPGAGRGDLAGELHRHRPPHRPGHLRAHRQRRGQDRPAGARRRGAGEPEAQRGPALAAWPGAGRDLRQAPAGARSASTSRSGA